MGTVTEAAWASSIYYPYASLPDYQHDLKHHRLLWRMVIKQALRDSFTSSAKPIITKLRRETRRWLLTPSQDLHLVCVYADIDVRYLKEKVLELLRDPSLSSNSSTFEAHLNRILNVE